MATKDNYRFFRLEARDLLARIKQALPELESPASDARRSAIERLVYLSHTLKGAAGVVGLKEIASAAVSMEALTRAHLGAQETLPADILGQLVELLAQMTTGVESLIPAPVADAARSDR